MPLQRPILQMTRPKRCCCGWPGARGCTVRQASGQGAGVTCGRCSALNRADTEAVCRAAGQPWVTDETNETDAYARNRLRRAALPALQSTNEAATENLARFCEKAAQADAYFAQKAEALLMDARLSDTDPVCWRLEPLAAADAPILETALHSSGGPGAGPGRKNISGCCAQLVQQGSGAVQLTGKVRFCAADGVLRQETQAESAGWDADAAAALPALQAGKPARMPLPGGQNPDCTGVPG